jgi:hypothetical protein
MARDNDLGQRKKVELDRGMFLIQYKSAGDSADAPKVVVTPASGHERRMQIFTDSNTEPGTLWAPETSLVVKTSQPATLNVEVVPRQANGSRVAAVRIEPIRQGAPWTAATAPAVRSSDDSELNLEEIRILGHVAGIGDVIVSPNQWLAGPSAPSRIEGIAVEWQGQPSGINLRYAVKAGAGQGPLGQMVGTGEFAGTRGRALPLTGLVLEISGELSDDYQLSVEAIFLSSPVMRVTGKRVVLSGPTGREPIVGLRLRIESIEQPAAAQAAIREPAPTRSAAVPPAAKAPSSSRVKVFRSRAKQDVG